MTLTLTADKLSGARFWRQVSWLDTPLVQVGTERLGASDLPMALAGPAGEEHMLRRAASADTAQYARVNSVREGRMIAVCHDILERERWAVYPRYRLREPEGEVDVYAVRGDRHLVLQLKSTLRPETPWEVYKRNEDILNGIRQGGPCARPSWTSEYRCGHHRRVSR